MEPDNTNDGNSFSKEVGEKEKRKLQAQKEKGSAWFGLGMFGIRRTTLSTMSSI